MNAECTRRVGAPTPSTRSRGSTISMTVGSGPMVEFDRYFAVHLSAFAGTRSSASTVNAEALAGRLGFATTSINSDISVRFLENVIRIVGGQNVETQLVVGRQRGQARCVAATANEAASTRMAWNDVKTFSALARSRKPCRGSSNWSALVTAAGLVATSLFGWTSSLRMRSSSSRTGLRWPASLMVENDLARTSYREQLAKLAARYTFWQTLHLASPKMKFYDLHLNNAVWYARHAMSIDENRADFARVPWGGSHNKGPQRPDE